MDIPIEDTDVIYEVKGRDKSWKVFYPDEGDTLSAFPWYDKEGKIKTVIYAGGTSGKLTELNEEFSSSDEAIKCAKKMGADKIKVTETKERKKKEE